MFMANASNCTITTNTSSNGNENGEKEEEVTNKLFDQVMRTCAQVSIEIVRGVLVQCLKVARDDDVRPHLLKTGQYCMRVNRSEDIICSDRGEIARALITQRSGWEMRRDDLGWMILWPARASTRNYNDGDSDDGENELYRLFTEIENVSWQSQEKHRNAQEKHRNAIESQARFILTEHVLPACLKQAELGIARARVNLPTSSPTCEDEDEIISVLRSLITAHRGWEIADYERRSTGGGVATISWPSF